MNIFVFSDSHGRGDAMRRICAENPPDAIVHLGDFVSDTAGLEALAPLFCVRGNCDFRGPVTLTQTWEGAKIFLCHGHVYGVKQSLLQLSLAAREAGCCAALFGHTHMPYCA